MDVPEVVPPGLNVRASTVLFVFALLLPIACVSLDKPPQVAKCAAEGNCSDDYVPPDNRDAAVAPPSDARVADEPTGSKEDLGPDSTLLADAAPGRSDVAGGKQDVLGGEAGVSDVLPPADARLPLDHDPPDVRTDAVDAPSGEDAERNDVNKEDVAREDGPKEDVLKEDVVRNDGGKFDTQGPETSGASCTIFYGASPSNGSQGHPPGPGSSAEFCVATCDDIMGWGCSNFDSGRKVTVNGVAVNCGDPLTKRDGYYVFRVSAGSNPSMKSATIYWWSGNWATSCAAPAGGF